MNIRLTTSPPELGKSMTPREEGEPRIEVGTRRRRNFSLVKRLRSRGFTPNRNVV